MDVSAFVGLPYGDRGRGPDVFDCWGLVRHVLFNCFNRAVPSYLFAYDSASNRDATAQAITGGLQQWLPVAQPQAGDLVILRLAGRPFHCGVMLDGRRMLHTLPGSNAVIEDLRSPRWCSRVDGYYRWGNDADI